MAQSLQSKLVVVGDHSLNLCNAAELAGKYVKYYVRKNVPITPEEPEKTQVNAFEIMMAASRACATHQLSITNLRNNKDKLHNDILSFIQMSPLKWHNSEVSSGTAARCLSTLTDVLWYIDGMHDTLNERSCKVPTVFNQFTGYNKPENHRHRKRVCHSMSREELLSHSRALFVCLSNPFWSREMWLPLKKDVEQLSRSLASYADLLLDKRARIQFIHSSKEVTRNIAEHLSVSYIDKYHRLSPIMSPISDAITRIEPNTPLDLRPLLPDDRRRRYEWIQTLRRGLDVPIIHVQYSPGSNIGDLHWIWQCTATDIDDALKGCQPIIEKLKKDIPEYHTRAMRRDAFELFGLVSPGTKKSVVRRLYKELVCDSSASTNLSQEEIDQRVQTMFDLEDASFVYDLRTHYGEKTKFDQFWACAKEYIEEEVGTAVDDRRHSTVVHTAKAISVRDLREKVVERCPPNTPVPSDEWIRLQFSPSCKSSHTQLRYTGRLNVKHMVQQRQWRKQHEDSHYAACLFRYEREYALLVKDHAIFACIDDKHRIKVGEPDAPVASAERGRQVIVHSGTSLQSSDHDFTTFSIIPSVVLFCEIPNEISGSWYVGEVKVMFKEGAFEPSSPLRHSAELANAITTVVETKPVLFMYSDGGPDHRVNYISVKIALIALFQKLDLDYLCAVRTAPYHSYRNPVERIMSIINIGLQAIALARRVMSQEVEAEAEKCNSMKALRAVAERNPAFREAALDSIAPVKIVLTDIAKRLELKGKKFSVFTAASPEELDDLWTTLLSIDQEFPHARSDKFSAKELSEKLVKFIEHCCIQRHYFFDILKCGKVNCDICLPPRLEPHIFSTLNHLPDPVPGSEGHYKKFFDVFGTTTTEEHRPSSKKRSSKDKSLPFSASIQHVKNIDMMLMCDECEMWRLLYAKRKLKKHERIEVEQGLNGLSFSCGAQLQDSDLPDYLKEIVFVRRLTCEEPVEKLYYSAKFEDICIYCSGQVNPWSDQEPFYPQCVACQDKEKIPTSKKRKEN